MDYELDFSKKERRVISNDAFYFFLEDAMPIDDANLPEIKKLNDEFENGFYILNDYELLENGHIKVSIVPYCESNFRCDYYLDQFNNWQLQVQMLEGNNIKIRFFNPFKEPFGEETTTIYTNKLGKQEVRTSKGSVFPFKLFIKA